MSGLRQQSESSAITTSPTLDVGSSSDPNVSANGHEYRHGLSTKHSSSQLQGLVADVTFAEYSINGSIKTVRASVEGTINNLASSSTAPDKKTSRARWIHVPANCMFMVEAGQDQPKMVTYPF